MKWRSWLCVYVWKNSREGEVDWKRETKQAKKRQTEREREKEEKRGKQRWTCQPCGHGNRSQETAGVFYFLVFFFFPFVFPAFAAMNQDVTSGLWPPNVCERKQSARLVIWAVEPGSRGLEIWRRCSVAFHLGAVQATTVTKHVAGRGSRSVLFQPLTEAVIPKRGETLWVTPALETQKRLSNGTRNCRFQIKSAT